MKNIGYRLLKVWIKSGLYLYYGKIRVSGLENVPKDKAVLFLPNHQGALLDVLLIAVDCNRKPFFLTRSDVFTKPTLKKFFAYLRMIPIYRIRDGREALKNNQAVFDQCAEIFKDNHAIVMFPEANHNIKRRVRPLSKGFTRILFNAVERLPETELYIVPVGLNYRGNSSFPDKVALYYDKNILVNTLYDPKDVQASVNRVKGKVSDRLKQLTTHIEDFDNYENIAGQLNRMDVDFLDPFETNKVIEGLDPSVKVSDQVRKKGPLRVVADAIFEVLNFPVILLWRKWAKPKVWEPEFMGTLRFGFSLLAYPVYYALLFTCIALFCDSLVALAVILALFVYNWAYVRSN
ncbi:lysophospholipid acyltransferase family protein [Zobellia galactanivorans]|uniref:lysophospholipid acyltransferase family protein n=1 Tax=Zobellia galactanivorans (strain DSM 12802 / CCUG 47099 / CIP 106680 / NCIMB 13871 / Dsij) TaxID=63186 RepID=UPI001C07369E|nr:lysophospholipid acyltransferase family protein [Zobellia galactanivorans]MBU3025447.1 lysophospholipid acyltransferase family protein [Zobellia galactanivorans]MDO6810336.1 lysophospholipid acyltransferase family protein [Zobellia galactanivorans]